MEFLSIISSFYGLVKKQIRLEESGDSDHAIVKVSTIYIRIATVVWTFARLMISKEQEISTNFNKLADAFFAYYLSSF